MNITMATKFDTRGHDEPWRNQVAEELNVLLWMAERAGTRALTVVALSLAKRVAEFEEIKVKS